MSLPSDEPMTRRRDFNAGFVAAGMIYSQAVTVISGVLIGRIVGATDYGVANVAKNLFQIAAIVTPMGLDLALQRYFAGRLGDDPHQRATLRALRLLTGLLALLPVIGLALGFGGWLESRFYRYAGFEWIILATFAALPFATDAAVTGGAYRGIRRPAPAILATYVIQPTARIAINAVLFLLGWRLWGIIAATTTAAILSWLYVFVRARRDFPAGRDGAGDAWASSKTVLSYSWAMGVALVITMITKSVDVLVLGHYRPPGEVGRYVAVQLLVSILALFSAALGQTLGASITERFEAGDLTGVERLLTDNARRIAIVAAPLYAIILFWGDRLDLILGSSFRARWEVVALLATNQLLFAIFAYTGYGLSMTRRQTTEVSLLVGGLVAMITASLVLVPRFGDVGAAAATVIVIGGLSILRFVVVRCLLDVRLLRWNTLLPIPVAIAIAAVVRFGGATLDTRTFVSTAAAAILSLMLYAIVAARFLLSREDLAVLPLLRSKG